MKKLLALMLTVVLCLCCLASCGVSYERNEFFSDELLSESKLTDMPVPPHVDNSVIQYGNILYLNLTQDEYEQYVGDLLEYLRERNDIYYLGYSVGFHYNNLFRADVIAPIKDDYDISLDKHDFFFSTEDRLTGRSGDLLASPVNVSIIYEYGQLTHNGFEYNTRIFIYNGIQAHADYDVCGAEHTYDEGIEYKIAGSERTITEYTCVHCGSTKSSDFIGDMKYYKVTIEDTDADHYIIDRCDSAISGVIVGFKTQRIIDADLKFVVNGTEIYPRETDDGKWIYEFVMPCEDIVITTEIVGDSPTPTNHFLRNQAGCEWLNEITAEDIAEIKIIGEAVGVAPGNLKNIRGCTDEAVIARIFEEYYWLDTAPISKMEGQIVGGSGVTVKFILKDGTEKELYINNGNYLDNEGNYFKLLYTPKFEESDNVAEAYGFITYIGTGTVYDKDNNPVCEIPIDALEFDYDLDLDLPDLEPYNYVLKTEFGALEFISPEIFYMETGEACVLVGKDLAVLIAEYGTTE